jgi:uncharacterized protein YbjT (DUF2867 family)
VVAGASGLIGARLIPLLVEAGHAVAGLTRTPAKAEQLAALGAEPVVADAMDRDALIRAVRAFSSYAVPTILGELRPHFRDAPESCARRAPRSS